MQCETKQKCYLLCGGYFVGIYAWRAAPKWGCDEGGRERKRGSERTRRKDNDVGVKRDVNEVRGEVLKHKGHLCRRGAPKWSVLIFHPG